MRKRRPMMPDNIDPKLKEAIERYAEKWFPAIGDTKLQTTGFIRDIAPACEAAMRAPGPCGKHPAMFWTERTILGIAPFCTLCAEIAAKQVEFSKECERFHKEGRKCMTCGRLDLDEIARVEAERDELRCILVRSEPLVSQVRKLERDDAALRLQFDFVARAYHTRAQDHKQWIFEECTDSICIRNYKLLASPQPTMPKPEVADAVG